MPVVQEELEKAYQQKLTKGLTMAHAEGGSSDEVTDVGIYTAVVVGIGRKLTITNQQR